MADATPGIDIDQARSLWALLYGSDLPEGLTAELRFVDADGRLRKQCRVGTERDYIDAVARYGPDHYAMLSLNAREAEHRDFGKAVSVPEVGAVVLDIEPDNKTGTVATEEQRERTRKLVNDHVIPWFVAQGFVEPVIVDSGNGIHALLAIESIKVSDVPDVDHRVAALVGRMRDALADKFKEAGARIDHTHNRAQVIKVTGTAKPYPGHRRSQFITAKPERNEDAALRKHLVELTVASAPVSTGVEVKVEGAFTEGDIPGAFIEACDRDARLLTTWNGERTDLKSRSEHDFALLNAAIRLGIREPKGLGAILWLAPYNVARWPEKGAGAQGYVERQIKKALESVEPNHARVARFTFDGLTYEVPAVMRKPGGDARVTLKVRNSAGDLLHLDTLPLTSAKKRTEFANAVAASAPSVPASAVSKHLIQIAERMEEMAKRPKAVPEEARPTADPKAEKQALEMLRDPALMDLIVADLVAMGHVGEPIGKKLVYLVTTSRIAERPLALLIQARSSAGKNILGDNILRLTPPEAVIDATSLSEQALAHAGPTFLKNKVLRIAEHIDSESNNFVYYYIRELLSKGSVVRLIAQERGEGKGHATTELRSEGPVAYLETTTKLAINEENATRMFVYRVDESEALTRAIHGAHRRARTAEGKRLAARQKEIIGKHHALQRRLKSLPVLIEYADYIQFPTILRTRRDHARFLDLIEVSALLHQEQRSRRMLDGREYIVASLADYEVASEIANHILADSLSDVPPASLETLNALRAAVMVKKLKAWFTKSEAQKALGRDWSESRIYRHLKVLVRHELARKGPGVGRYPDKYRVSLRAVELNAGLLPTHEVGAGWMRAQGFRLARRSA